MASLKLRQIDYGFIWISARVDLLILILGGLTPENKPTNPHSLETSSLCIVLTSNKESAKLEIISW